MRRSFADFFPLWSFTVTLKMTSCTPRPSTVPLRPADSLKAAKRSGLTPGIRLLDPSGTEQTDLLLKGVGGGKPKLRKFVVPADGTGVWTLLVDAGGNPAAYTALFKVKTPKVAKRRKLPLAAGATETIPFVARTDALITVVVKRRSATTAADLRVLAPDGSELYTFGDFTPRGAKILRIVKKPVAAGFGTYTLELTGDPGADSLVDVTVSVRNPKIPKRRVILTPDSGDAVVVDTSIDMTGGNPATVSVPVVFPLNVRVKVNAWTL